MNQPYSFSLKRLSISFSMRFYRLLGVLAGRFDLDFAALSRAQGQHAHDASAIGGLAVIADGHL